MRVNLHWKKRPRLWVVLQLRFHMEKPKTFWKFSLLFSAITFMILPYWIIRAWEIYIRLTGWMDYLLEQPSETCLFLKSSGQNVFYEEILFCGKSIYSPTFSSHYSPSYMHSVFYFFWVRLSMLMIFLSWAL